MEKFEIIDIPEYKYESLEQLGTKRKFWYTDDSDNVKKLFKIGRLNTGENWVEVVVSKICEMLDIPHAKYEFAKWNNINGTTSTSFVPPNSRLVHGNELLAKIYKLKHEDNKYPVDVYKVRKYQLKLIIEILSKAKKIKLPIGYLNEDMYSSHDVFMSYIMLDCLISNPDRHHENWGLIMYENNVYLAPTYDHASGLGCRESDAKKEERLKTKDSGFTVSSFVKKAKTPFHQHDKNVTTIDAFKMCANTNKNIADYWLSKLENLDICEVREVFNKVPKDYISDTSIEFAIKILEENKKRLIKIKEELSK